MSNILSGTLNNLSCKQVLLDLMNVSVGSKVITNFEKDDLEDLPGTGFFSKNDLNVVFTIECKPGEILNYWQIICIGVKGMSQGDRLHYFRTVMQIDQHSVSKENSYGAWEKLKKGYSRGITYGLDHQGRISIYILDYSVATGRGVGAKLKASGADKRHEQFASYPFLSTKKNLIYNKMLDVSLPKCYFNDQILKHIPLKVYDEACCVEFEGQGIAHGSIKEQAYEAILPILINKPNAKVAVNIVASIEITASLLIGERGGKLISLLERKNIDACNERKEYTQLLLDNYEGLLQILYDSKMEGYIFKKCGMKDSNGNHLGVVYFIGE